MKLELDNFQSITHADINFEPGITCIQGCSASGKSALLRAIKAVLLNPSSTKHYVQEGAKSTTVTLESNGYSLTWNRDKSTITYYYLGEEYQKASKQNASDFCDLGFIISPKGKLMNILDEWDVLFPFGESDTELFKIFEDLFSIADSAKIIDGMKADENTCNKNISDARNSLNECIYKIGLLDKALENKEINQVDVIIQVLAQKSSELENLYSDLDRVENLNSYPVDLINQEIFEFNSTLVDEVLYIENQLAKVQRQACLSGLDIPEVEDFDLNVSNLCELRNAITEYTKWFDEEENAKLSILQTEVDLKELKEQYATIEVCPLCGQPIEKGLKE